MKMTPINRPADVEMFLRNNAFESASSINRVLSQLVKQAGFTDFSTVTNQDGTFDVKFSDKKMSYMVTLQKIVKTSFKKELIPITPSERTPRGGVETEVAKKTLETMLQRRKGTDVFSMTDRSMVIQDVDVYVMKEMEEANKLEFYGSNSVKSTSTENVFSFTFQTPDNVIHTMIVRFKQGDQATASYLE